jgi:hypothetical protein
MIGGTHSDNLVELQGAHLAAVEVGAGPFWVQHCEVGDVGQLWGGDWRRRVC